MDRDLDVLTALLLDPCLTTGEAIREAAARRGVREIERTGPDASAGPKPLVRSDRLQPVQVATG
jgi:hypothetical protein